MSTRAATATLTSYGVLCARRAADGACDSVQHAGDLAATGAGSVEQRPAVPLMLWRQHSNTTVTVLRAAWPTDRAEQCKGPEEPRKRRRERDTENTMGSASQAARAEQRTENRELMRR